MSRGQRLATSYLQLIYWWRHGRWPDLANPRRFTEWVQWRKLNDRRPALSRLTDKLEGKRLAGHLAMPTLWSGTKLPLEPPGPFPLMVKANHGCGQLRVVRSPAGWRAARRSAALWLAAGYGFWLGEGHYRHARRLILVEPFLAGKEGFPEDYKVYVFGGRAAIVQHHRGRGTANHRWTQFDRDWVRVGGAASEAPAPRSLARMIAAAELLAAGHDFLRVDFYEIDGRLWFGEFCLFPGSGLDPFDPPELDDELGELWSAARAIS